MADDPQLTESEPIDAPSDTTPESEPPKVPKKQRARKAHPRLTLRNLTYRTVVCLDSEGNGIHILPRGTVTIEPHRLSEDIERHVARQAIKLS